jgi:hypothetical protein
MKHAMTVVILVTCAVCPVLGQTAAPARPPEQEQNQSAVFLKDNVARPLRYTPEGRDFVITNGAEFFNRPLYGGNTAFRVDGGDKPEFSLYMPGHGGNLRLGIRTPAGTKWLHEAERIVTRYGAGSLRYEVGDPLLGDGVLRLTALRTTRVEGLLVRTELEGAKDAVELLWVFGGVNGMRGRRSGDIGCESEPVGTFFQLRPSQCTGNVVTIAGDSWRVEGKPGIIAGVTSGPAKLSVGDAANWNKPAELLAAANADANEPLLVGRAPLHETFYLALYRVANDKDAGSFPTVYRDAAGSSSDSAGAISAAEWSRIFDVEQKHHRAIAERVVVETPDAFINAAAATLNVAADAIWDEKSQAFMHGAVAWRSRLLGWRGAYAGDALGWHERTAAHFAGFADKQNTKPIPAALPPADEDTNLSRSEAALHSSGDMTNSHYDMNLVGVDAFFRHLLWTGDLDYARRLWPAIERHFAWERRLFRREFGPDKLPLYEAYCCIWASDDVAYNGGGTTYSTAYNLYHNRMAARVARLIGKDPSPYEQEAELLAKALRRELWLTDRGWFGEYKDLLGRQLVHPNAAAWTFYHTLDCEVPTPQEAWQMTRFVDTQIARIPLSGPGVPQGCYTMPSSSWMPYSWSVNNVVMAEVLHTSLGYWQAGRPEEAFCLFKGAVLDSMYLGLCPGNVGMCTYFDTYRRESQRDFGDGIGTVARALVEGLFGVQPDALAGELRIRPGFPAQWPDASIRHPDFRFSMERYGSRQQFFVEQRFAKPMTVRLQTCALRDDVAAVTVNGEPVTWSVVEDSVGMPRIEIQAPAGLRHDIVVEWKGRELNTGTKEKSVARGAEAAVQLDVDELLSVEDPQGVLSGLTVSEKGLRGKVIGMAGHRTLFATVGQGAMRWRQPVSLEIQDASDPDAPIDWRKPLAASAVLETIDLGPVFNDKVTQIFHNEYRSPRSPFCSLALPKHGIGTWCHPMDRFDVDDSGLRSQAAKTGGKIVLPNGVPLATPSEAGAKNIAFISQWDNYPREISVPLAGKASRAFLLMAGSTNAMQSRFDNGEVVATYKDGTSTRLALHNPTAWWPIDQDYYIDDFAFVRPEPLPPRIDLKTGRVRLLQAEPFKGQGRTIPGGAATVLTLPLNATKELQSLTIRALANEVVIGLMSVTLAR